MVCGGGSLWAELRGGARVAPLDALGTPPSEHARRIRDYFKRYRRPFVWGIVCLTLTQALALSAPQLLRIATDAIIAQEGDTVKEAALGLMLVALLGAASRIASRILIFQSGRRVEYDIRNDCFDHLSKLAPSFYQKMPLGQVMSRMVNDLTQVRLLLGPGVLNTTNTALVYLVALPLLFLTDAELALYALSPMPLLLFTGQRFSGRLYAYNREAQERLGRLSTKVQENLSGVMTVRVYGQEDAETDVAKKLADEYVEVNVKLAALRGVLFPLMGLAGALGTVVVLYVGGRRIARGEMTVGEFVQFNAYLAALTWPTIALGWMLALWQRGMAALDRINQIFVIQPSIVDGPASPKPFLGDIELKNLTFSYPKSTKPVLKNLTLRIEAGQTVVIVGRTGSGKSTLLKILARQLEVPAGALFVDGLDALELPLSHTRGTLGYAPQDSFLFSRSLYENVAFGKPGALEPEVREASRRAQLEDDLGALPDGLNTLVGERGITLSGGQRQRTTLARALLVEPRLLLLDDTLSAVDSETESRILKELHAASVKRTTVVATHRLAFAKNADQILVLEEGELREQGTEAQLLAAQGLYKKMHDRQRIREALESRAQSQSRTGLPA